MPLVTSSSVQGNLYRQATQPANWVNGDVWVDTDDGVIYTNNNGTSKEIGFPAIVTNLPTTGSGDVFVNPIGKVITISTLSTTSMSTYTVKTIGTTVRGDSFDLYANQAAADASWVSNDTAMCRVNVTNDNLDFNLTVNASIDDIAFDLGAGNVSNSAWIFRAKIRFSTLTASGSNNQLIGLSSTAQTSSPFGTAEDGLYLGLIYAGGTIGLRSWDLDGATISTPDNTDTTFTYVTGVDYYIELKRTSTTTYVASMYADDNFSSPPLLQTKGTCPATITGLRYIKLANNNTGSEAGVIQGTLDNVEFYNAIGGI